uniref:uncharacterized protein n=1 Tax=Myxine glutinosa TaxID=7769 RepID=UPI00358FF79C
MARVIPSLICMTSSKQLIDEENHQLMMEALGDRSPSYETIPRPVNVLYASREYVEDGASGGLITTATDEGHVQRVDAIPQQNRSTACTGNVQEADISSASCQKTVKNSSQKSCASHVSLKRDTTETRTALGKYMQYTKMSSTLPHPRQLCSNLKSNDVCQKKKEETFFKLQISFCTIECFFKSYKLMRPLILLEESRAHACQT